MMIKRRLSKINQNHELSIAGLQDAYINEVYYSIYKEFYKISKQYLVADPKNILELGAGSLSKAEEFFPNVKITDGNTFTRFGKENQVIAEKLPFPDEQFELIIAKDTLHHFSDTHQAISEISRVLKPGGVFIVSEPYWSILGRLVFRYIHPEGWDTNPEALRSDPKNPLSANQATLKCLTISRFNYLIRENKLNLYLHKPTYGFSYLLSGGLNWRNRIPCSFLMKVYRIETKFPAVMKFLTGLNILAVIKKQDFKVREE